MQNGQGMSGAVGARLSVMMFIQFLIWGAWYVTAPRVLGPLGFSGGDLGWTYSVGPLAGIISPLFVGMIADRFFATKYVLAAMHLGAAGAMCLAITLMNATEPNPALINAVFFLHMLCYFPTLALANTIAMQNMTDSEKQFPFIRVFGTIGWIVAGLLLDKVFGWATSMGMFYLAAGAGFVLGAYSLTLPYNPPPSAGRAFRVAEAFGLDALGLLKKPSFLVFMLSSFLICIPLAFYYQMAERTLGAGEVAAPAFKMTFGQMSEVVFLLLMPLFFARFGVKRVLLIGMIAWAVRYGLFAIGASYAAAWIILPGIMIHGICYGFVYVAGQIYIDKKAPVTIRAQAQGLFVLVTYGLGQGLGTLVAGWIFNRVVTGGTLPEWQIFWIVPLAFATVVTIVFAMFFREDVAVGESAAPA